MPHTGNMILDSLSPSLRDQVVAASRPCHLALKATLVHRGRLPSNLVFLTSGMASLIVGMVDGGASEVGMLGRESVTGISTLLGPDTNHTDCLVQISGDGLQVPRQFVQDLFQSSREFRDRILSIVQSQLYVAAQVSACNLRHQVEARFARWVLTASDRTESATLPMTQEFLAEMLGNRRTTVSLIVGPLEEKGFIKQNRGTIHIVDRPGLATVACECYAICRDSTYGPITASDPKLDTPMEAA